MSSASCPLLSGLRLSLVLIPVKLHAATTEGKVAFRQIHAASGNPIRNVKGVRDGETFTEVPDEEIIKGYEHAKGHHVLIHPKELDDLKLEAKHTIDMVRFVDEAEIDSRFLEKPYYLTPDGDDADEGYTVIREALKQTGKEPSPSMASPSSSGSSFTFIQGLYETHRGHVRSALFILRVLCVWGALDAQCGHRSR